MYVSHEAAQAAFLYDMKELAHQQLEHVEAIGRDPFTHAYISAMLPPSPLNELLIHPTGTALDDATKAHEYIANHQEGAVHVMDATIQLVPIPVGIGIGGNIDSTHPDSRQPEDGADVWAELAARSRKGYRVNLTHADKDIFKTDSEHQELSRLLEPGLFAFIAYQSAGNPEATPKQRDDRMQSYALHLQSGGKPQKKFDNAREEVFYRNMLALHQLAESGKDSGLSNRIANHLGIVTLADMQRLRETYPSSASEQTIATNVPYQRARVLVEQKVRDMAARTAQNIGADPKRLESQYRTVEGRRIQKHQVAVGSKAHTDIVEAWFAQASAAQDSLLHEVQIITVARNLMAALADGRLPLGTVFANQQAMMSRPLADYATKPVDTEALDWEILPPSETSEATGRTRQAAVESDELPPGADHSRIVRLEEYIKTWGDGYVARSRIPNLPEDQQYYLAILPQTVGGVLLEHAIGDNPEPRRHAVYAWRAEAGLGRFGQPQRTWQEVFRETKTDSRRHGAVVLKHTATLDERLLDFITKPTDDLRR